MKKLIIFGISGFAEVAHFYFTKDSNYDVVAFTANKKFITKTELFGLPVIPFEDLEKNYPPEEYDMFIAIVYTNVNKVPHAVKPGRLVVPIGILNRGRGNGNQPH